MNHESNESRIKVFISYSHDSSEHVSRVYSLAQTLRIDGIDCNIDQFAHAPDNWDRWMLDQIENADFVLIICSERYYRRYRGKEEPGNGLGVTWESTLIMGQIYEKQGFNSKFYPVFFGHPDRSLIPDGIRTSYYSLSDINIADLSSNQSRLSQESGYEALYRLLTNQPSSQPIKTGSLVRLESSKSTQQIRPTPHQTTKDKTELLINNDLKQMPDVKGPYQGLRAFSSATRKYFFGRTDIATKILERFKISRFCILSGNSGVGKSSLLEAGLLPSLREEGWTIPRTIRPGPDPISELNSVLLEALRLTKANKPLLRSQLRSRYEAKDLLTAAFGEKVNRRVIFVVDQLEEVFTLSIDPKIQSDFFGILTEIIESNLPGIGVILVIRSDFTGRCLDDSQLSRFFNDQANVIYITPMKGESIRQAIVEPAKKLNYCVEDGLVSELIEEASRQTGSLPLLQFALSRLWELSLSRPGLLTLDSYNRLGGLSEILNGYADRVLEFKDYQSNNPADSRSAAEVDSIKKIFLKLVRPGRRLGEEYDTRQRVSMEQLAAIKPASIGDSAFNDLIQDLIDSRLIVGGGRANEVGWIDLAHETLTSAWSSFARWLKVDRDVRRLAERIHDDYISWIMGLQSDEYLLSGGLLRDSLARVEKLLPYLGEELESFLDKSRAYNEIKLGYRLAERRRGIDESQFNDLKKPHLTQPPKRLPGFENKAMDLLNKYSLAVGSLRLPTPGCYADPDRCGLEAADVFDGMTEHLFYTLGKLAPTSSRWDLYTALSYAVRDRLMTRYLAGSESINASPTRVIAYLSAEFLIGPQLNSNLMLLGIQKEAAEALRRYGIADIDQILEVEEEPGLGMSGLGRLAACFMESLASLQFPATGYGIRYEFGIFDQLIRDGWQVEITDKWLKPGFPWEIPHPDQSCFVGFGGRTESYRDDTGRYRVRWIPAEHAIGVPHDVPVLGYRVNTCGRLRLWRADATESFDFYAFNIGDYYGAVEEKVGSETLSKVLYPNDGTDEGRRLRLKQQFFFVSCSVQDMLRSLEIRGIPVQEFPDHWAVQLNDTQPAIAVAELMRLLLDDKTLEWDQAWDITKRSLAYTNHTLLPEALEKWSLDLFGSLLPRHLEIICEINRRFLQQVRLKYPGNDQILRQVSIIDEEFDKSVCMARLATIASHHVNGVSTMQSELIRTDIFTGFASLWPEKFTNVTNGVSPRRWLALANPRLSELINEAIGEGWVRDLSQLCQLEQFIGDSSFLERWGEVKLGVKRHLTDYIYRHTGVLVDPASMFDVQVTRIHEYKRQHLNALQVVAQYLRIKNGLADGMAPRTVIFGGKAAPGYAIAKLIIRFINGIAETVNADPDMEGRLRVVFLPDYNVKLGERVYPAADLSEQISTAGKEASGTGNMKFAMNGALTIGTFDGANVEIRQQVGEENFFLFGKTAAEIAVLCRSDYRPWELIQETPELPDVLRIVEQGHFSNGDSEMFRPLLQSITDSDPFFVIGDFLDYIRAQDLVSRSWEAPGSWNRMSLLNTARIGFFSSDRSIREYAERIWRVGEYPVTITCELDD